MLQCLALAEKYVVMEPRSGWTSAPLPTSAMNMIRGVRRVHIASGLTFAPTTMAATMLRGMLREYIRIHHIDAVAPNRKCPFPHTHVNNVLLKLLRTPDGVVVDGTRVDYTKFRWVSGRACFEMLAETGNRGDEARRFTFASLVWFIGGAEVHSPTQWKHATPYGTSKEDVAKCMAILLRRMSSNAQRI